MVVAILILICNRENTLGWSGASHLSSPSTDLTRGLAARRLFKVPPCREGTIHLQTSMSSPRFEPSPNGTAVTVANHYTGWALTELRTAPFTVASTSLLKKSV
ncbi:hypothetical protein TNCV_3338331 [Trichonephila clavipes]|nr:hypothetical protein TNCV_3338331 [Trichonephila clavipes]